MLFRPTGETFSGAKLHLEINVHSDDESSLHETIKELLNSCDSVKLDDESLTVAASSQAAYEETVARIKVTVTSKFNELREAAEKLLYEWCKNTRSRMMEQPYLQILNNDAYCLNAKYVFIF